MTTSNVLRVGALLGLVAAFAACPPFEELLAGLPGFEGEGEGPVGDEGEEDGEGENLTGRCLFASDRQGNFAEDWTCLGACESQPPLFLFTPDSDDNGDFLWATGFDGQIRRVRRAPGEPFNLQVEDVGACDRVSIFNFDVADDGTLVAGAVDGFCVLRPDGSVRSTVQHVPATSLELPTIISADGTVILSLVFIDNPSSLELRRFVPDADGNVGAATATFPLTGPGNDPRATMIRLPTSDGSFKALLTFQNGDALVVDVGASLSVTPKGRFFAEGGVTLGLRKSPTGEDTVLAISNVSTRPGFVAVEGTVAALLSNEAGGGVDAFVAQPVSPNIFDTSQLFVLAVGPEGQTLAVGQNGVVVGETRAPRQFGTLPFAERLPEVVQFANAPDGAIWALMERGILARWSKGALFEERNVGRRATNVLELPGFGHESVSILPSGEAIIGSAEEVIRVSIPVEETEPPVVVTTSNPARPGGGFGSGVPSLTVRMPGGTRENAAAVVMTNGDIYQMTLQPNAITFGEAPRPLGDVGLLPPGDRGIAVKAALDPKFNDAGAVAFWAAGVAPKDVRVVPAVVRCVVTRGVVTCAEPVEVTTLQSPRFDSTEAVASIQVLEDHLVVVYRSGVAAGLLTGIARDTYKEQGFDGQGFPAGLAAGGDLWVNGGNAVRTGDGCWVFGGRATQLVGAAVDEVPIALAVTHRNEAEAQIPQLLRINEQLFLGAGPAGALFGFAMEPQTDGRCFDPPSTLRSAPPALLGPKRSVTTLVAAGFLDGKTLVGDVTGRVWSLPLVCE